MKISVLNTIKIDEIPSGSGIAKSGNSYYVIGDDSPFLYELNEAFDVISQTRLIDSNSLSNERIIKSEKPDFESLEMIGEKEIVVLGSGSKSPQRDIFIRILLEDPMIIEMYDISDFYKNLKNLPIFNDSELNIEATAYRDNQIFLFNRNKNLILQFKYTDLLSYIKGEITFSEPVIKEFSLPKINGIEAGFSGATVLKNESKLIFTASVENTDNAYDDGEILGSFIGLIDISDNIISDIIDFCQIPNSEVPLKVESITIDQEMAPGNTKVILITDDDMGNSTLIESVITW